MLKASQSPKAAAAELGAATSEKEERTEPSSWSIGHVLW